MVRAEVDARPPAGAVLETTIVRGHSILNLWHHDRASLLAGKLRAVLQRAYTKGRDLYDLLWYLSARDWPEPNLVLLNNALAQTGWPGPTIMAATWREVVLERLGVLDWAFIANDLRPFLENQEEVDLVTHQNLARLLGKRP